MLRLPALRIASAAAQAGYPDKPVRIVVPFAAGGVADITARIVAEKLGDKLGQRFLRREPARRRRHRRGATVISSPPDGYTLALLSNGTAVSVSLFKKLPFDPLKDFAPISSLGIFRFRVRDQRQFANSRRCRLRRGREGKAGHAECRHHQCRQHQNLSAELFKTAAGIDFTIIPYRGTPEILVSLLQGNIALMIDSYSSMKGNLADGKFRALASSGAVRSESTPDIATVQEGGVANYDVVSWNALFAPAGTPPEIIKTLNGALQRHPGRRRRQEAAARTRHRGQGEHAAGDPDRLKVRHRQVAESDREGRNSESSNRVALHRATDQIRRSS